MFGHLTPCGIKAKISANVRQRQRRPTLKALRRARADAGLTISELAKRAGVSRDTISNAERGQHSLQATTLHKVARALGRAPSELLAEEERLAPKAQAPPSPEQPSLNGLLEEERRLSRFSEAIIAAAARWGEAMSSTDMDDTKRTGLVDAALDLSDLISERALDEDWEALTKQERREIVTTMEKLAEAAGVGVRRLEKTTESLAQEQRAKQRREEIKEMTRRISA